MADSIRSIPAAVVGLTTDMHWGQVLQTPHAYGVVEMYSPDGIARTRGIQLLTKLTRFFDTPPVSLSELTNVADSVINEDVVSLMLLVPVGATLYLVSKGDGCAYLKRGNKLAKLISGENVLSGDIVAGDTVIAASSGFAKALAPNEIIGVFDHLSPSEVAEKLTMRLHERAVGEGGAALIFTMSTPDITPAVIETEPDPRQSRTLIIAKAKAVGRRFLPVSLRVLLRRMWVKMRTHSRLTPRYLITYTILFLFFLSVVMGIRRQITYKSQSVFHETLVAAEHSFNEGMALMELNPVKGRERLTQARDILSPIVSKKRNSEEGRLAEDLYEEITKNLTGAMHITQVEPELYFDMSLKKSGATASDISLFESTMGVLDIGGKTAYTLGSATKQSVIAGGGEAFTEALHIASHGDKLYVWTKKGIHQIRLSDQKTVSNIIPASSEWGTIADMVAFGGNIYLLDTGINRIWKYVATEKSFSELFEYLNPDTLVDLSKATNMAIDGSVWLGTSTGGIQRFTAGKENSFTPQGSDVPLGMSLRVYTSDIDKLVYVLDTSGQRVVVFDKEGLYVSQYVWGTEFSPTGFVVSETDKKILLLRDGKIYSIAIK